MINNKIYTTVLFCVILCFPFVNNVLSQTNEGTLGKVDSTSITEIRIDPRAALADSVYAKDVFKSVQYIPLETTKESVFGKIDQLEITDKYFIVLDSEVTRVNGRAKSGIMIFDKQGKFHSKIGNIRTGYFALNYEKSEIVFQDYDSVDWVFCDFNGKQLRREERLFRFYDFTFLKKDFTAYYRRYYYPNEPYDPLLKRFNSKHFNLLVLKDYKEVTYKYLPFDTLYKIDRELLGTNKTFFRSNGENYFVQPDDYNVYQLTVEKLAIKYKFVFPLLNSIPVDFHTNSVFINKRRKFINDNRNVVYSLGDLYKLSNYLFFTLHSGQVTPESVFFYNLKTSLNTSFATIIPDATTFNLPVGKYFLGVNKNYIFSYLSQREIQDIDRKLLGPSSLVEPLPEQVKRIFNSKNYVGNPLIVKIEMVQ